MSERQIDYHPVVNGRNNIEEINASRVCCAKCKKCVKFPNIDKQRVCCSHSYLIPIFILFILVLIVLLLPWETIHQRNIEKSVAVEAPLPCQLQLVETLPVNLKYNPPLVNTFDALKILLDKAKENIDIVAPYWNLRGVENNDTSSAQGQELFNKLLSNGDSGRQPKLLIRIVHNRNQDTSLQADAKILANYDAAKVTHLELDKNGQLHTKLWIVDNSHFYLGSANMDWRSFNQTKEFGVLAQNCPNLARDLVKIFKSYWQLSGSSSEGVGVNSIQQDYWPYHTFYNDHHPLLITVSQLSTMRAFISSAPPALTVNGRTHDLDAILKAITTASEFIYIAILDYYPLTVNGPKILYWPHIDNALRQAAVDRGVAIKMLISWWSHSDPSEDNYLRSLQELTEATKNVDIQIRRFVVPSIGNERVNHNSYMVTDNRVYIGSCPSWSGDYFTQSAGISLILEDTKFSNNTIRTELCDIFMRDWLSPFALRLKPPHQYN